MIGPKALLVQIAVVAFVLILGVVFARIGIRRARTNKLAYVLPIIAVLVMLVFTAPLIAQVRTFMFLRGLRPADIRSMSIGDHALSADQVVAMTQAVQDARWFTTMHGGWGMEMPLEIQDKNGRVVHLFIARYPSNGSGAIIGGPSWWQACLLEL